MKAGTYAAAGIEVYWIVNLVNNCVEAYSDPDQATAVYRQTRTFAANAAIPVILAGVSVGSIAVSDLLP